MIKKDEPIRTGADIANEITSYEAMHEPSLNTEEYKNLVGTGWVSLEWLKEQIETKQKRINLSGDNKFKAIYNNALDWMFMLLKEEQ